MFYRVGIKMNWDSVLGAPVFASLITALVTLVGIIVSYVLSKKNLENEINSIKTQQSVERMRDLPARVAGFLDEVRSGLIDETGMSRLLSDIYAYGSPDAIKILVSFQETNYKIGSNRNQSSISESFRVMGYLTLLISQLKYDLSGQYVDPELYFKLKISDYGKNGITARGILADLVKELELDEKFISNK